MPDAEAIAKELLNPDTCCELCGVPNRVLKGMSGRGALFPRGNAAQNWRLTPDNLRPGQPHTLANTRLLCFGCNVLRGHRRFDDHKVAVTMTRDWKRLIGDKSWMRRV